ncbi:MAG: aminopeptidase [Nanohaloarchaea archaeon]|nr:aminopeptidase [Candidatus Nanohaloarchaea archaeon]
MKTSEDPRLKKYAETLVERSAEVEKGDDVYILVKSLEALPLFEEVRRQVIDKGGFPHEKILYDTQSGENNDYYWMKNASEEQLERTSEAELEFMEKMDSFIKIKGLENNRSLSDIDPQRISTWGETTDKIKEARIDTKWALCAFPTNALAQQSEMATEEFEEFIFKAVNNTDWKELERKNEEIKQMFDKAQKVRIKDENTDLSFSIEDREGVSSIGRRNIPDGEVFYAPRKDSFDGKISFEHPVNARGKEVSGIELTFEDGELVEYTADTNQEFLEKMIETDEGSKYVGEFGIGTNRNIDRYIKYTLFDEKIGGTVHFALGRAYKMNFSEENMAERNESSIHWDIVKDLRKRVGGGKIILDGEVVQKNGEWVY